MNKSAATHAISRRRLVGTSGAGLAAGLGAMTFAGSSAFATQTEIPESWDIEVDVVVVGAGGAGTTAAIEASRAGASVAVFEKAAAKGGNTSHSGGVAYLGGGTDLQQAHGFEDTPDNMFEYLRMQMGETTDLERLRFFCDNSVEHYNWLLNEGVVFGEEYFPGKVVQPPASTGGLSYTDNQENYPYSDVITPAPRGHMSPGAGAGFYRPLGEAADALAIDWYFNTRGQRLIMDGDAVIGIVVQAGVTDAAEPTDDGTPESATPVVESAQMYVKANKGVILTTGGFQFNQEMLAVHAPRFLNAYGLGGPHLGDDGSGIKMGAAAGGETFNLNYGSPWNFIYSPGELTKSILVDSTGRRFIAETLYGEDIGNAVFERPDGVAWLVMDSAIHQQSLDAGATLGEPVAIADTLDELADQLGVNVEVFLNEVAFYNEQAAAGEDPVHHKKSDYVQPLEQGPFMAYDYGVTKGIPFITLGGLRSDINCNVINHWGETIPGLYSAGRTSPGLSQESYVSGSALSDCTFWGRIAGKAASAN